jgi:L-idonate 5-dehydrogenase
VEYLSARRVDVRPLLSGQYPLQDAVEAFHAAADKNKSTKVQIVYS